jgi:hypothetical protein
MKNINYLYLAIAGIVAYFLFLKPKTTVKSATAVATTGTAATASPSFWTGWLTQTQQSLTSTTAAANQFTDTSKSLLSGIAGLFGGASKATGSASPQTSGGGAGVPVDSPSADSSDTWTPGFEGLTL